MMDQKYIDQIERVLERPLEENELEMVDSLDSLSPAQFAIAKVLARRQLVLGAMYLRKLVPSSQATLGDIKMFMDAIA